MSRSLPDAQLCYGVRDYLEHRHNGRNNAIHGKALAARFGVHPRRIGEAVAFLVAQGCPIAATAADGYWLLVSESERQAALAPERRRLAAISRRVKGLDRVLAEAIQRALDLPERAA
jgi:predicted DNA-binding transcriptional regulator YafY